MSDEAGPPVLLGTLILDHAPGSARTGFRKSTKFVGDWAMLDGTWSSLPAQFPTTQRYVEARGPLTIDALYAVEERAFEEPLAALVLGTAVIKEWEPVPQMEPGLEVRQSCGLHGRRMITPNARPAEVLTDTASHVFRAEIDNLDARTIWPGFDTHDDIDEIPNVVREALIQHDLDELAAADMVIRTSSSYGLKDRHSLKAQISWPVEKPLTIAEQKRLVLALNERSRKSGREGLFDPTIYKPTQPLYTRPARVLAYGADGQLSEHDNPAAHLRRIWKVYGGGLLRISAATADALHATAAVEAKERKATVARRLSEGDTPEEAASASYRRRELHSHRKKLLASFGPDRTAESVLSLTDSLAKHDQRRLSFMLPRLKSRMAEAIRSAYPAGEAADKIAKHLTDAKLADQIQRSLDNSGRTFRSTDAPRPLPMVTVAEARVDVARAVRAALADFVAFQREHDGWATPIPIHVLAHPWGVGKSRAIAEALDVDALKTLRVAYLAPTIALAEQQAALHRELAGVGDDVVRVHKGFVKSCLDKGVDGRVGRREIGARIGWAGVTLRRLCAGDDKSGAPACPFVDTCSWPRQQDDEAPGCIYMAHANFTSTMRAIEAGSARAFDLIVIDESIIPTMIGAAREISLADLRAFISDDLNPGFIGIEADLRAYGEDLWRVVSAGTCAFTLYGSTLGAMETTTPYPVRDADGNYSAPPAVTKLRAEHAWDSFESLVRVARSDYLKLALGEVAGRTSSRDLAKRIKMLDFICDAFRAVTVSARFGRPIILGLTPGAGDTVRVHLARDLPDVSHSPTIILDGSFRPDLMAEAYRDRQIKITISGDYTVTSPYTRVTQVADRTFAKSSVVNTTARASYDANGDEIERAVYDNRFRKIARLIAERALRHGRGPDHGVREEPRDRQGNTTGAPFRVDVGVILPRGDADNHALSVDRLRKLLSVWGVTNVAFRHFGAVRGMNDWRDIRCVIVIGRECPHVRTLEDMAAAIHWRSPDLAYINRTGTDEAGNDLWMQLQLSSLLMADGTGRVVRSELHHDAYVESIRAAVADDEVRQAIARGRPLGRCADRPLDVLYLGTADTGLPLDELWSLDGYQADVGDLMLADGLGFTTPELIRRGWGAVLGADSDRSLKGMAPEWRARFEALAPRLLSQLEGATRLISKRNTHKACGTLNFDMQLELRRATAVAVDPATGSPLSSVSTFYLDADLTTAAAIAKIETRLRCRVRRFLWLDPIPLRPPAPQLDRTDEPAAIAAGGELALVPRPALPAIPPSCRPSPQLQPSGDREMIVVQDKPDRPARRRTAAPACQPQRAIGEAAAADDALSPTLRAVFERMRHTPGRPNPWRLLSEQMAIEEQAARAARAARKAARKAATAAGGAGAA